jgi:hypothetical protein
MLPSQHGREMPTSHNERIDHLLKEVLEARATNLKISKVLASRDLGIFIKSNVPNFTKEIVIKGIEKKRKNNGYFQI